jgi:hypothetical protein
MTSTLKNSVRLTGANSVRNSRACLKPRSGTLTTTFQSCIAFPSSPGEQGLDRPFPDPSH